EMARAGADLAAGVSFHGSLETASPAAPGAVQPRLLVCTGAADPFVPTEHVDGLRAEMDAAGARCEIVAYPDVIHAFTNPGASARGERFGLPLRYDEGADKDSWARMAALLEEVF
ncbi:MAG: dienelactone hydrolase family protein, partial [Planctomycetota bacterium]|nr:dienelactone hydrolase family protein [Planctomycetota bacterium]